MFLTADGSMHILAYAAGTTLQHARALDPVAGKFSDWKPLETKVTFSRIFPLDPRNGSTIDSTLEGVMVGAPTFPQKDCMFYFVSRPRQ